MQITEFLARLSQHKRVLREVQGIWAKFSFHKCFRNTGFCPSRNLQNHPPFQFVCLSLVWVVTSLERFAILAVNVESTGTIFLRSRGSMGRAALEPVWRRNKTISHFGGFLTSGIVMGWIVFKAMDLFLSGPRDGFFRYGEISIGLNRTPSRNCRWWHFFPTVVYFGKHGR